MAKYKRLTREDRYTIERLLASKKSVSEISDRLGFHRSSIYKEIKRNKCLNGRYKGRDAWTKTLSHYYAKLYQGAFNPYKIKGWVEDQIIIKLNEGWSPEQISNRLKNEHKIFISFQSIYNYVYQSGKRGSDLHKTLR